MNIKHVFSFIAILRDLTQGKTDFDALKHVYETTMEALENTKIEIKSVNDELTKSNLELLKSYLVTSLIPF